MSYNILFDRDGYADCSSLFKECSVVSKNLDWDIIAVALKDIEKSIVCKCLGEELYEYICKLTKKKNRNSLENKTLEELQYFMVKFAEFKLAKNLAVLINNKGIQENSNDGKTQPASRFMYNEFKWDACRCAYDSLERLIYKCILPNKKKFPDTIINNSPACKKACVSLVYSPENFLKFGQLETPGEYKSYLALIPYLKRVEECDIINCLCNDFYCQIKEDVCNGTVKECHKELLESIQRYIVNQTLLLAATEGVLRYGPNGWAFTTQQTSSKTYSKGSLEQQRKQCAALSNNTSIFLEKIKSCLELNKDKPGFELFKECCEQQEEKEEDHDECCPCGECCNENEIKNKIIKSSGNSVFL